MLASAIDFNVDFGVSTTTGIAPTVVLHPLASAACSGPVDALARAGRVIARPRARARDATSVVNHIVGFVDFAVGRAQPSSAWRTPPPRLRLLRREPEGAGG
jgi:hypothetical protein